MEGLMELENIIIRMVNYGLNKFIKMGRVGLYLETTQPMEKKEMQGLYVMAMEQ